MSSRTSLLDDQGDPNAQPGSREWAIYVISEVRAQVDRLKGDARSFTQWLDMLGEYEAWKSLGYASMDMLCHMEIGIDDEFLQAIQVAEPSATLRSIHASVQAAKSAGPPPRSGELGRGRGADSFDNIKPNSGGGTSATYLARRLMRDFPEIFKKLDAGEFSSVRAAAKAAGIVKDLSRLEKVQREYRNATEGEQEEIREWIKTQTN